MKSVESSFPSDLYFNDFANSPESVEKPTISEEELKAIIEIFLPLYKYETLSKKQLAEKLIQMEPMASNSNLTLKILDSMETL